MEILERCPLYQNKNIIRRILDKTNYNIMTYDEIFIDDTRKVKKIKKGDYLASGRYQIIDQGQDYIGGYTDENESIYNDIPFIIFGDHTRIIKYIDEPSFIGADGVKVLNIKDNMLGNIDIRYIYYYLLYSVIPNDGYSRHFKYVKNLLYVIPPIEVQRQIVEILDEAQKLIDNRKEQLKLLDDLIESIFYDMFGDPVKNDKGWEVKSLEEITSKIGSGATPRGGESAYKDEGITLIRSMNVYDNKFVYKGLAFIDDEQASKLSNVEVYDGDILINITGASINRTCIVPKMILPARVNQHVSILRIKGNINNIYLLHLLISKKVKGKLYSVSTSGGATREAITKGDLETFEIPIPPIQLQNQFAEKVELIEKQKSLLEQSLRLLEDNYNNLMQKAFKGELF